MNRLFLALGCIAGIVESIWKLMLGIVVIVGVHL